MPTKLRNLTVRAYPTPDWEGRVRGTGLRKTAFFTCNTTYSGDGYIHMKTNISADHRAIYIIEAVGYNYGNAQDVFCFWGFKPNQINDGGKRIGTRGVGIAPEGAYNGGVYVASSEVVALTAYASSYYYIGFALNAYVTTLDGAETSNFIIPDIQITAAEIVNYTSGPYY